MIEARLAAGSSRRGSVELIVEEIVHSHLPKEIVSPPQDIGNHRHVNSIDCGCGDGTEPIIAQKGAQPLGTPGSFSAAQLQKLAEARALIAEVQEAARKPGRDACTVEFSPHELSPARFKFEFIFLSTWEIAVLEHVECLDLGMLPFLAMAREADLIEMPYNPNLPHLEGIERCHQFAPNDMVYRLVLV